MFKNKRPMNAAAAALIIATVLFSASFAGWMPKSCDGQEEISLADAKEETSEEADDAEPESEELVLIAKDDSWKLEVVDYTGFFKDDMGIQYLNEGDAREDTFFTLKGNIYKAEADGYLVTGWYDADEDVYFFDEDGISRTGWIEYGGSYYYLKNHEIYTGWHELSYADETGWYYFDEEGKMLEDCETPDGYYVGKDGRAEAKSAEDGEGGSYVWNKDTSGSGTLSGLEIAGMPAEFYMLSIAGETSGMASGSAMVSGDKGRAYGACQFDYRYDLVDFMNFAYGKHPSLWSGFAPYLSCKAGSSALVYNEGIANAFLSAMNTNYETCISDQLEFVRMRYWDSFASQMNAAGFHLSDRNIAVSAALLSVNVNCGAQANIFINNMSPNLSDEEMIRRIYDLRNSVFASQSVGSSKKGTNSRYTKSEPQMALDLLYGYITIDSNVSYGSGVEWHGNPFTSVVSTTALPKTVSFSSYRYDYDGGSSSDSKTYDDGTYEDGDGEIEVKLFENIAGKTETESKEETAEETKKKKDDEEEPDTYVKRVMGGPGMDYDYEEEEEKEEEKEEDEETEVFEKDEMTVVTIETEKETEETESEERTDTEPETESEAEETETSASYVEGSSRYAGPGYTEEDVS